MSEVGISYFVSGERISGPFTTYEGVLTDVTELEIFWGIKWDCKFL